MNTGRKKTIAKSGLLISALFISLYEPLYCFKVGLQRCVEQHTYSILQQTTEYCKMYIQEKLDGQFYVLESMAQYIGQLDNPSYNELIEGMNYVVKSGEFYRLAVSKINGQSYTSDGKINNVADSKYFQQAKSGKRAISECFPSFEEVKMSIVLAVPIIKGNKVVGILSGVYDSNELMDNLCISEFEGEWYSGIITKDGDVIIDSNQDNMLPVSQNLFGLLENSKLQNITIEKIKQDLLNGKSNIIKFNYKGCKRLANYTPLHINDWYILNLVSYSEVVSEDAYIQKNVLLLSIKVMGTFILLILYIVFSNQRKTKVLKQEKETLRLSEERYRILAEQSESIIFEDDLNDEIYISFEKFKKVFNREPSVKDFPQSSINSDYIFKDDINLFLESYQRLRNGDEKIEEELRIKKADGKYLWCLLMATALFDENNKPYRIIGKITNIDRQKRENQLLIKKAQSDLMTGLYNKLTTQTLIDNFLRKEGKFGIHALMIVDVDNFKGINDTLGHMAGDTVLTTISNKMKVLFRSTDIIGRVGGDEFIVFLKNIRSENQVRDKADQICSIFRTIELEQNLDYKISGSIGISSYVRDGDSFEELYMKADIALYVAKKHGKDRYSIYNLDME